MTVAITEYTDTDRVRAALGVDSADVSDNVLVDMQLDIELIVNLLSWVPGYASLTSTSLDVLKLYAATFCALSALHGRELLYPISFKDGKAETRRFPLDIEKVKDNLAVRLAGFKKSLASLEGITLAPETHSNYIFGGAAPNYDPVAGA